MDFIIKWQQQNHETLASEGTLEKIPPKLQTQEMFSFFTSLLWLKTTTKKKQKSKPQKKLF